MTQPMDQAKVAFSFIDIDIQIDCRCGEVFDQYSYAFGIITCPKCMRCYVLEYQLKEVIVNL